MTRVLILVLSFALFTPVAARSSYGVVFRNIGLGGAGVLSAWDFFNRMLSMSETETQPSWELQSLNAAILVQPLGAIGIAAAYGLRRAHRFAPLSVDERAINRFALVASTCALMGSGTALGTAINGLVGGWSQDRSYWVTSTMLSAGSVLASVVAASAAAAVICKH